MVYAMFVDLQSSFSSVSGMDMEEHGSPRLNLSSVLAMFANPQCHGPTSFSRAHHGNMNFDSLSPKAGHMVYSFPARPEVVYYRGLNNDPYVGVSYCDYSRIYPKTIFQLLRPLY